MILEVTYFTIHFTMHECNHDHKTCIVTTGTPVCKSLTNFSNLAMLISYHVLKEGNTNHYMAYDIILVVIHLLSSALSIGDGDANII